VVKAVIGFYGAYDMQAQWEHDQMTRPRDRITTGEHRGQPGLQEGNPVPFRRRRAPQK